MATLKQVLSYIILGQKGGENRVQIIDLLRERPYNINQLADLLGLNYRTVKHHIDLLLKNGLISSSRTGGYGEVYFLSAEMEGRLQLFEEVKARLRGLVASPRFFQMFVEQTQDALIITDDKGEVAFWNRSAETLFGYKVEEVLGTKIPVFPDEGAMKALMERVCSGRKAMGQWTRLRRKSGEPIDASVTADCIKGEDGSLLGYSILSRDVTERHRAAEELRLSEERYSLAQRLARIGNWDWNIATGELKWSEMIEPMFGFKKGEFRGTYKAFLARVHPDDRALVESAVNACIHGKGPYDIEHRIVWPDGTVRWVMERGDVHRDEGGKAVRMLGVVRDITGRKDREAALFESERKYRLLFRNLPGGFALLEAERRTRARHSDFRILEVNRSFERLTGLRSRSLIGKTLREVFPDADASWMAMLAGVARTGKGGHFRKHSPLLKRNFDITAYCPKTGQIALILVEAPGEQ